MVCTFPDYTARASGLFDLSCSDFAVCPGLEDWQGDDCYSMTTSPENPEPEGNGSAIGLQAPAMAFLIGAALFVKSLP